MGIKRDRPLYLMVQEGESFIWFVIEDGRQADDGIIFRRIGLPQLPDQRFPHSLVVIDSKLYLMGGHKWIGEPRPISVRGYEVVNLEGGKRWHHEPLSKYVYPTEHLASCKDGLIYVLGRRPYILNPAGPVTTDMPLSCDVEVPYPLAISNKKIYAYSLPGRKGRILVRYDLEANKWDPFSVFLWGDCAIGVVLEQDSYLVTYGTRHPVKWENDKPGVWVFDIRRGNGWMNQLRVLIRHFRSSHIGNRTTSIWVWAMCMIYHAYTKSEPNAGLLWFGRNCGTFVARQLSNKVETLDGRTSKVINLIGCTVKICALQRQELQRMPGSEDNDAGFVSEN
ncbi:hypothetical protein OROMI_033857 [Orobanche minor]